MTLRRRIAAIPAVSNRLKDSLPASRNAIAAMEAFRQPEFLEFADFAFEGILFDIENGRDFSSRYAGLACDHSHNLPCPRPALGCTVQPI